MDPLIDNFLNSLTSIFKFTLLKDIFNAVRATMLPQRSCLTGIFFVCYCIPGLNAGITMHNSLLDGHVFKTYFFLSFLFLFGKIIRGKICSRS